MISSLMPTYNRADLAFERGEGAWLYAADGRRFLDFGSGIATSSLGHNHPGLVAAIAEQSHDEQGLVWPREVAPADVHVVIAGKDDSVRERGEAIAAELDRAGVQVVLDDRTVSPGVKFKDAELIGVPTIVVAGKGVVDGVVEVKDRKTGERTDVPLADLVARLTA